MDAILEFLRENIYWIKLGAIPFVAGFITWLSNRRFIRGRLSLQQFQSRKAELAAWNAELVAGKLLGANEVFDRLDPEEDTAQMQPQLRKLAERVVDNAMEKKAPAIWKRMPDRVKRAVYELTAANIPKAVAAILEDLRTDHEKLLDFQKMYTEALERDANLLRQLYAGCSAPEATFFKRFGWWLGFLLGAGTMAAWHFYPEVWVLPLGLALGGLIANTLAWNMIFSPSRGKFIRRKETVAAIFAELVTQKILGAEHIWEYILDNEKGDPLYELMQKHVDEAMNNLTAGTVDNIANMVAPGQFREARDFMVKDIVFRLPAQFRDVYPAMDRSLNIRPLLQERLMDMAPADFTAILRPVWGSAWRPVLLAACSGGLAGFFLWAVVFRGLI